FVRDGEELTGFVVNHEGALYAYVNRCAHVTYSLDIGDGQVMDRNREFILCSVHGARYLPESGRCFLGRAVGRSLESLPLTRHEDEVTVSITPEPPGWPRPAAAP
ncbi:MAG: Rieske 2Fe-2S domain-containing protein, partial [Myxococcota bacterium]|nr:Rieske 2Fe-2S domain-containing protein [Myxococcota bacterium]